jgi:hypothetical protein
MSNTLTPLPEVEADPDHANPGPCDLSRAIPTGTIRWLEGLPGHLRNVPRWCRCCSPAAG